MSNHDEKRALILKSTWGLMEEFGYKGTTLDRICKRTGMARGNFYHYFDTKEAVFFAIMDEGCKSMNHLADCILDQDIPAATEALSRYLGELAAFRKDYKLHQKLALEAAMEQNPIVLEGMKRFETTSLSSIGRLLEAYKDRGLVLAAESSLVAFVLYHAYTALVATWEESNPALESELIRVLMEGILNGLCIHAPAGT